MVKIECTLILSSLRYYFRLRNGKFHRLIVRKHYVELSTEFPSRKFVQLVLQWIFPYQASFNA